MYRAGIIGCGFIGWKAPDSHAQAYMDCADTVLYGACDNKNPVPLPKGKGAYTDYLAMVKTGRLDIVSVCTPPETHCQIVCGIAPYVKAIYCEKPIALTLEDADRMIETCHKHNVILQINHQRAFRCPEMRFSRDIIGTGSHAFELLTRLFGPCVHPLGSKRGYFGHKWINIEYVDSDEYIFELDCTHNTERMILAGVETLVDCLDGKGSTPCSGDHGYEALRLALQFKEKYERTNRAKSKICVRRGKIGSTSR